MFSNVTDIYTDENNNKHIVIKNINNYRCDILVEDFNTYMNNLNNGICDSKYALSLFDPKKENGEFFFFEDDEQERVSVNDILNSFFEYSEYGIEDIK